jgi:hypothetical protein
MRDYKLQLTIVALYADMLADLARDYNENEPMYRTIERFHAIDSLMCDLREVLQGDAG